MQIDKLGVHESVDAIYPPAVLRDELAESGRSAMVVADGDDLSALDMVVTFEHRDDFLEHVDWVHSTLAGVDRYPLDAYRDRGVVLTNSSGVHRDCVGDTVAGFMLSFARRLHRFARNQVDHDWNRPAWDEAFTLVGESVCVVGLGALGRGIAERAAGLGMTVTGVRRSGEPVPHVERVYPSDQLHEAVEGVRFVALAVPLTDETHHLIDREVIDVMRDDAYLLNVARGQVVDEAAMIDALESGSLAGAGLDVFETEPLPAESPLWDFDEVIISPHCAGLTDTYYRAVADLVRENIDRLAADTDLTNRVT